jgi:DNA-binding MarR family transcriptional regulator
MAQLFDRNGYRDGLIGSDGSQLPALESLAPAGCGEKEKAAFILRLLRQAASENREGKSQEFYSIRTVARHFGVPPTTVTRVYDKLKEEGVLASIWGSKTFIEPLEINRDIRVKAIIGLPASLRLFAAVRNYRMFFVAMQDMLWKHGFATRLLFCEKDELEMPNLADRFLGYKVDVVIWYGPNFRITNTAGRLIDRGVHVMPIFDSVPVKCGDHGFYVNRCRAVGKGLAAWKRAGVEFVKVLHQGSRDSLTNLTMIEICLHEIGLPHTSSKIDSSLSNLRAHYGQYKQGFVFATSDTALQLASEGATQFTDFLRGHRAMFVEGAIDLLNGCSVNDESDLIEVDWSVAARRIGNNFVERARCRPDTRVIFEADWVPRTRN